EDSPPAAPGSQGSARSAQSPEPGPIAGAAGTSLKSRAARSRAPSGPSSSTTSVYSPGGRPSNDTGAVTVSVDPVALASRPRTSRSPLPPLARTASRNGGAFSGRGRPSRKPQAVGSPTAKVPRRAGPARNSPAISSSFGA